MKYRDHRGSLDESMKTVIEINSIQELKDHLNEYFSQFKESVEEIQFDYLGMDNRVGWVSYCVRFRLLGDNVFYVAGTSDGILNK